MADETLNSAQTNAAKDIAEEQQSSSSIHDEYPPATAITIFAFAFAFVLGFCFSHAIYAISGEEESALRAYHLYGAYDGRVLSFSDQDIDHIASLNKGWKDRSSPEVINIGEVHLIKNGRVGFNKWNIRSHGLPSRDGFHTSYMLHAFCGEARRRLNESQP
jgi:hypothetical protein